MNWSTFSASSGVAQRVLAGCTLHNNREQRRLDFSTGAAPSSSMECLFRLALRQWSPEAQNWRKAFAQARRRLETK